MMSVVSPTRVAALALAAMLLLAFWLPRQAAARLSMVYALAEARQAMLDARLGPSDGVLEQHPARGVFDGSVRAWKVTGRTGTTQTPSLAGLNSQEMADVLRDRIDRSGGHLVFVDELGSGFRGDRGDRLAAALELLAAEESPWGGASMAERVHIYVPGPRGLLAQPDAWAGGWRALTLAGGVWLEAYLGGNDGSPQPWTVEQWLAWPRGFRELLIEHGGDPERLHLLMTSGDQERQWRLAATGGACDLLRNGPGTYRIGPVEAVDFVAQFRAQFGNAPAPAGPSPATCLPTPSAPAGGAERLYASLGARAGLTVPQAAWPGWLWVGLTTRRTLSLGSDPGGIAAHLGADPATFWEAAGARVITRGAGAAGAAPVMADGTAQFAFTPEEEGPVRMWLEIPGSSLTGALAREPFDVVAAMAPYADELGALSRQMLVRPSSWRLLIPLSPIPGQPTAPIGLAQVAPGGDQVARVGGRRAGLAERAPLAGRRNPRRWSLVVLTARAADGLPVPGAELWVQRPWGRPLTGVTNTTGRMRVWVPSRGGSLEVQAAVGSAATSVTVPGKPPANARVVLGRASRREVIDSGRNPAATRGLRILVRARGGGSGGRVGLQVRRPGVRPLRIRTDGTGRAIVPLVRRRAGVVSVRIVGGRSVARAVVCRGAIHRAGAPAARSCA